MDPTVYPIAALLLGGPGEARVYACLSRPRLLRGEFRIFAIVNVKRAGQAVAVENGFATAGQRRAVGLVAAFPRETDARFFVACVYSTIEPSRDVAELE